MRQIKTLREITGERPRCACCNEDLKPVTSWIDVKGEAKTPPSLVQIEAAPASNLIGTLGALKDEIRWGYRPERVFRITQVTGQLGVTTHMRYWRGTYKGVGRAQGRDHYLFCNHRCAVRFGCACWAHGMRMERFPKPGDKT